MKKAHISILVFLAGVSLFIFVCGTASAGYTTTQLTNNAYAPVHNHQINNNGQVVWDGDGDGSIYLYSGGVFTQLTDYGSSGWAPQINDASQVVWDGDGEIFLCSGGVTTQLTSNSYDDRNPQINDSGQIVWEGTGGSDGGNDNEIFLYSGGVTTQLTSNSYDDRNPQINDSGQVVWEGNGEIYLYSGGVTTKLVNYSYGNGNPQINDSGQVVWWGWDGYDYSIYRYSGGFSTQLTSNNSALLFPQINDSGQVVWQDGSILGGEIYLYSGGLITHLSNSSSWNRSPQINGDGQIVWRGYDDGGFTKTFLYSDGVTTVLTNPIYGYDYEPRTFGSDKPQINDAGEVVWDGWDGHGWQVFFYRQCNGSSQPTLALSRGNAFWASYADYTARKLSVNMTIRNSGTDNAYETMIMGSYNTNGVTDTGVAVVGDIAGGASSSITLIYHVPAGVVSFRTTVYVTAQDSCGTTYSYPGPYPGL